MKRLAKRHSFKPTVESLETRWCPTASITTPLEHTVTVTGDDNANAVQIIQNDDQNTLIIITESAFRVFASDRVENVVINLNGGNDRLTYGLSGGSDCKTLKIITVDLGSGSDTAIFNFADNGNGGLATVSRELDLSVQAQLGNDRVDAYFGTLSAHVNLTGNMGFGDDRFSAELKGSLLSSTSVYGGDFGNGHHRINMEDVNDLVLVDPLHPSAPPVVLLPGGSDDFRVTVDAAVAVTERATLDVILKGGDGSDNLQFQSQGEVDGGLTLLMDGQDDADTVSADIRPATGSTGSVSATVLGGDGDDTLGLFISNPGLSSSHGLLNGGGGYDHATKSLNVLDRECEVVLFRLW